MPAVGVDEGQDELHRLREVGWHGDSRVLHGQADVRIDVVEKGTVAGERTRGGGVGEDQGAVAGERTRGVARDHGAVT
jgi:hypothetical protein